jgi:hypothetical protein
VGGVKKKRSTCGCAESTKGGGWRRLTLQAGRTTSVNQPPRYETNATEEFCALQDFLSIAAMDFSIGLSTATHHNLISFFLLNHDY